MTTLILIQMTWPEDLYEALSIAFDKKKEFIILLAKIKHGSINSCKKTSRQIRGRAEIFEQVERAEKAVAIAGDDQTKFMNGIKQQGWYVNKDNFNPDSRRYTHFFELRAGRHTQST